MGGNEENEWEQRAITESQQQIKERWQLTQRTEWWIKARVGGGRRKDNQGGR